MTTSDLSENFQLAEFLRSQTAQRHGIDMTPPDDVMENLQRLCALVLQPVRDVLGPIHITSGWRPLTLNKLIGGSRNSQHIQGLAADIVAVGHSPHAVCEQIEASMLPFDQLILEFGRWTHVSAAAPTERPRREVLTARRREDGKTEYLPGLVAD